MTKDEESAFRRWWCNYEITRKKKSEIVAKDAFHAGVSALMLVKQTLENDNAILRKRNAELIQENEEMKKGLGCETCQIHLEFAKLNQKITELEAQIEKMKSQYDYAFNQLCESREIICLMLSQYRDKKEIDYSTRERGEKLLKQGVYKND